jgi:serine/threonine-protein kinase
MEKVSEGKIGKYEIIKVLGRGGMGEVLLAEDTDLGRRVAIKRPFKSALEDGLARFQVEAKAATLSHPNIPAVYEMGVHDGLPFIAMEFVEGEPLNKIIDSGRQLDLITKLRIIEQVCSALGYAHEKGIIHRDIKPANVIVQPDGVAKIIDFGIAKIQDADGKAGLTQTSQVIGSLHYIAPERFKGGPIDGRVDLFSAGVTLFKLLTGVEPFTGGEATASYKIVNEAHSSLGTYLHDYPPVLDDIVAKALAKSPDDRYQTGEDFADALHEVIEDLKRNRVTELFNDAERLTTESRFSPALELLEEAIKLDPANTQVRKLRKFVREHQERARRAERLRECTIRADEALLTGNFEDALNQLRDAQNLDATSTDIRQRIQVVEEKKRRSEISARAVTDAEQARNRGDVTAALRIVARALQEDPDNQKLLAANALLAREAEIEAQRGRLLELLEKARRELTVRNLAAAEQFLAEAEGIDPSNLDANQLRREIAKIREQEQRREILEEIQARIADFVRTGAYGPAADLLNRALEKLPNETMLHRLKTEVETESRKSEARRFVDGAISQARELFASSPFEALAVLQKALDQMPGEERLLSYERSLRQQLDALRVEQLHSETLAKVRELLAGKQFDKAIEVLESFQLEFGHRADIDELQAFAREELAKLERSSLIDRCASEARALVREGRFVDAIRLLDTGVQDTRDASLTRLLEEVGEQYAAFTRKVELLKKRAGMLQERGELDEAIQLLREQLTATPGIADLQELLTALLAEQEHRQMSGKAMAAAREAAQRRDFIAALEALEAVQSAYGESAELSDAIQQIQNERSAYAQEVVGRSLESARAALLRNDPQGALEALKGASKMMEFADQKKQADWQRIGQSVKKALEQSGTTASAGAAFDAQLSAIAGTKPKKSPVWIFATGALVLVAVVAIVVWKMQPPPVSAVGYIKISKAPPNASVSIDNANPRLTDSNGELTVQVKPGSHQLQVTKDGFAPFADKADVSPGGTYQDAVSLTRLLPAGTSGTLTAQGNLTEFKLSVDGTNMGVHKIGQPISLAIGSHNVRYTSPDDPSNYQDHTIQIALNQTTPDSFFLKPAAPKPAAGPSTQPSAKQAPATQAQTQAPAVQAPQAASPTPAAQPTGSLSASPNPIERGQPVTLAWQVNNASTVSISGVGTGLGPQGSTTVYPGSTTKYQLMANGSTLLQEQTVEVHEPKPQPPVIQTPVVNNPPPVKLGPDLAALSPALKAYTSLIESAPGKNCKAALSAPYGGKLKYWTIWCEQSKSFEVREDCSAVRGTPDAPTLTCTEIDIIHLKDGSEKPPAPLQRIFRFSKLPDGSWQLTGW